MGAARDFLLFTPAGTKRDPLMACAASPPRLGSPHFLSARYKFLCMKLPAISVARLDLALAASPIKLPVR